MRGKKTIAIPFAALIASTVTAIVIAAQTGLAFCADRIALPMPDMASMPGMDMGTGTRAPVLMVCPVVLALIIASAVLAFGAVVVLWRDPHGRVARYEVTQALARLPLFPTSAGFLAAGGSGVVLMLMIDGAGAPAFPAFALLSALVLACSLAAAALSIGAGRCLLALGTRIVLAIVAAIGRVEAAAASHLRFVPVISGAHAVPLLAAGRGLRAPPRLVR